MSCQVDLTKQYIKWTIDPLSKTSKKKGNIILDSLYNKNEYTGTFQFELQNNKILSSLHLLKSGNSDSVESIPSLVNMHTHNLSNYVSEKCIFASPSGEDMRECIRLGLQGNLCHLVFCLEGTYVIQINPCYLDILRKDIIISDSIQSDCARGAIVYLIECYFKSTHGHRTVYHNKKMEKELGDICYPDNWIKFANEFTFSNFFDRKNKCSPVLRCDGVPSIGNKNKITATKYMSTYGSVEEQFKMSKKGDTFDTDKNTAMDILKNHFQKIVSMFDKGCVLDSSYSWNKGQFFYTQFFPNKFNYNSEYISYRQLISELKKIRGSLTDNIFEYWKNSKKEHIKFDKDNLPYILFHPLNGDKNCKIVSGKELMNWIRKSGKLMKTI